jgi:hypothetical protein
VQFLLTILLQFYACYYLCFLILFLHLLSTNHKCTQPCYFPLLLKPAAQKKKMDWILQRGVQAYMLPRLPFLWCYGVFCCSVSFSVVIVFRDIVYVIIILYSWHLVICEHFCSVCMEQLILCQAYDEYLVLA